MPSFNQWNFNEKFSAVTRSKWTRQMRLQLIFSFKSTSFPFPVILFPFEFVKFIDKNFLLSVLATGLMWTKIYQQTVLFVTPL